MHAIHRDGHLYITATVRTARGRVAPANHRLWPVAKSAVPSSISLSPAHPWRRVGSAVQRRTRCGRPFFGRARVEVWLVKLRSRRIRQQLPSPTRLRMCTLRTPAISLISFSFFFFFFFFFFFLGGGGKGGFCFKAFNFSLLLPPMGAGRDGKAMDWEPGLALATSVGMSVPARRTSASGPPPAPFARHAEWKAAKPPRVLVEMDGCCAFVYAQRRNARCRRGVGETFQV